MSGTAHRIDLDDARKLPRRPMKAVNTKTAVDYGRQTIHQLAEQNLSIGVTTASGETVLAFAGMEHVWPWHPEMPVTEFLTRYRGSHDGSAVTRARIVRSTEGPKYDVVAEVPVPGQGVPTRKVA